jgi:hypothetical protein
MPLSLLLFHFTRAAGAGLVGTFALAGMTARTAGPSGISPLTICTAYAEESCTHVAHETVRSHETK